MTFITNPLVTLSKPISWRFDFFILEFTELKQTFFCFCAESVFASAINPKHANQIVRLAPHQNLHVFASVCVLINGSCLNFLLGV